MNVQCDEFETKTKRRWMDSNDCLRLKVMY